MLSLYPLKSGCHASWDALITIRVRNRSPSNFMRKVVIGFVRGLFLILAPEADNDP